MTTALEIATYIHNTWHRFSGEMQMHKLLYYAQAWSLAWDGQPLFDDPIEAWDKGPVVRSLRYETLPSEPVPSLSESQQATIEAVLDYYGKRGGAKLSQQTHEEPPWQQARDRHSGNNRCTEEITHDSMRRAYTQRSRSWRSDLSDHGRALHSDLRPGCTLRRPDRPSKTGECGGCALPDLGWRGPVPQSGSQGRQTGIWHRRGAGLQRRKQAPGAAVH